jgi:hypothetical protein
VSVIFLFNLVHCQNPKKIPSSLCGDQRVKDSLTTVEEGAEIIEFVASAKTHGISERTMCHDFEIPSKPCRIGEKQDCTINAKEVPAKSSSV